MWFDGQRQPNTLYVANTSRGKDSTAMLRAIQLMGWPLDMIVSVDIWFDQDTPAELPPMVAFKDEYDQKVLEWFGVPVTRLCATKRESETDGECHSRLSYCDLFYTRREKGNYIGTLSGFPKTRGSWCKKLKYEKVDLLRHLLPQGETKKFQPEGGVLRIPSSQRELVQRPQAEWIAGFPNQGCPWCTGELKNRAQSTVSHIQGCAAVEWDGAKNSKEPRCKSP